MFTRYLLGSRWFTHIISCSSHHALVIILILLMNQRLQRGNSLDSHSDRIQTQVFQYQRLLVLLQPTYRGWDISTKRADGSAVNFSSYQVDSFRRS